MHTRITAASQATYEIAFRLAPNLTGETQITQRR